MPREEIISLCEVTSFFDAKSGQYKRGLQRYYDVDTKSKRLIAYSRDSVFDPYAKYYYVYMDQKLNDEQAVVGAWGLWRWWKEGELIKSEPYKDLSPIQIIAYSSEPSKIVERLKNGVQDVRVKGNIRTLFANISSGVGVLCTSDDLEKDENTCRFSQDVYSLPQIYFSSNSILSSNSNSDKTLYFLKDLVPNELRLVFVYPENAIASVVESRLSQNCKSKEIRMLQYALKDVTTDSITQEVARKCRCNESDARKQIDKFLDCCRLPQLLFDEDVRILSRLLERDERLSQKCVDKVEERWLAENEEQIKEVGQELARLKEECQNLEKEKNELQKNHDFERQTYQAELEKEKGELAQENEKIKARLVEDLKEAEYYEQLVSEAQRKLQDIQLERDVAKSELSTLYSDSFNKARQEVGRYLADLAIYSPNFVINPNESTSQSSKAGIYEQSQSYKFISNSESFCEETEYYDDELDAVDLLEDALKGIGFEKNSAGATSSFLWSVYFNQRPLILAGAYAQRIAEVTSCALTGRLPDVLVCEGACEQHILDEAFANPDSILLVKNPLDGSWFERLASELSVRRKPVFLSVPFVENLRLIPPSFFDVALPYITNLSTFDKSFDSRNVAYKYGVPSVDFQPQIQEPELIDLSDKPTRISMGRCIANNVEQLLAYSVEVLSKDEETVKKVIFQFGLFSYAYATNSLPAFFDLLRENNIEFKRNNPFKDFEKFA